MIREIVNIDEEKCDGCGVCVPECHEGALQIIDGKARLISDLMCDGLGNCLGHCPQDAITIEKREAEPYDETKVMEIMISKGANTVIAHLKHLKDHNEIDFLNEAFVFLETQKGKVDMDIESIIEEVKDNKTQKQNTMSHEHHHGHGGGCPGSRAIDFSNVEPVNKNIAPVSYQSELRQWPVQMHLVNPNAGYFQKSDLLLAADCVPFSMPNFHSDYLKGRSLAILCPKLDDGMDIYINKIQQLIDKAQVNTITVMIMQVPCCGGLLQITKMAAEQASRKVPIKSIVVGLQGEILKEEWV